MKKIGIIICARYQNCGGGKCFRALRERCGGFSCYDKEEPVEVVGYSTCGGCVEVCPQRAIREVGHRIGVIRTSRVDNNITLIQGCLDIGVAMAPPLIRAVKARLCSSVPAILDAPPGTSCPVIATIQGADYVALVTEPTPFGLNDLKLAVEMVRELRLPFGVVINRVGIGDDRVHLFCKQENIPILLEIPDDRRIAEAYSRGKLIVEALPEYRRIFENLLESIMKLENIGESKQC